MKAASMILTANVLRILKLRLQQVFLMMEKIYYYAIRSSIQDRVSKMLEECLVM